MKAPGLLGLLSWTWNSGDPAPAFAFIFVFVGFRVSRFRGLGLCAFLRGGSVFLGVLWG